MRERRTVQCLFHDDGEVSRDGAYADCEMILRRPIAEARHLVGKKCRVTLPHPSGQKGMAHFDNVEFRSVFLVGDETHAHVRFWA